MPGGRSQMKIAQFFALASVARGSSFGLPPEPGAHRGETGRDRQRRRNRAKELAQETGLNVEDVYRALGAGETEEQIRARAARPC